MTAPQFTEDWFGEASQKVLADLVRKVANVPGIIVEVGAWEGRSTIALADAAICRPVVSCDTWEGSAGEISATLAADRDVFATWKANTADHDNVVGIRGNWRDVLPTLTGPIALAFIDAEHTRTEVADNIRALLPLMSPGGIICGDDIHHGPVQQGVLDVLPGTEVQVEATLWHWRVPIRSPLADMYAEQCKTPSDIWLHLPRMVELVEALDAKHVIELGTRTGVSTIAWLHALERTGGRLTSVDLDAKPPIGDWPHWSFIQADDLDPNIFGYSAMTRADVVFIDTSHHLAQTRAELEKYLPLVRSGGVICLHDTELEWPEGAPIADGPFPVKRALTEFVERHGFECINYPDSWGFAIVKVG